MLYYVTYSAESSAVTVYLRYATGGPNKKYQLPQPNLWSPLSLIRSLEVYYVHAPGCNSSY